MIIGLIGVKGSGKTTAAEHIMSRLPRIRHVSFAGKLKIVCARLTEQPYEYFEKQELKELEHKPKQLTHFDIIKALELFGVENFGSMFVNQFIGREYTSNRQLMQILGTDILRAIDDNIHITSTLNTNRDLLISDVRFSNEAKAIDEAGGYLIYIQNEYAESKVSADSHESEKQVMEKTRHAAHFVVNNDGKSLEDFQNAIDEILFDINYYTEL